MKKKSRGYTREETAPVRVRDYTLFAIACEGAKREGDYFELFEKLSSRIKVDIIKSVSDDLDDANKSSPKWVLDRAMHYIEENGLTEEDQLWFVIDVDRWSKEQIVALAKMCDEKPNWNIAISNVCFEVWLYYHYKQIKPDNLEGLTCKDLKRVVSEFEQGGYNSEKFILKIDDAINNAKANDSNKQYFFPEVMETKVYLLCEKLLEKVPIETIMNFLK